MTCCLVLTLSEFHYLRMRNPFYFQDCVRVNVAFLNGFLHAILAHHVHNRRVPYHVNSFFNRDFPAVVELVLDVENDFSLSQSSPKQFTVADG